MTSLSADYRNPGRDIPRVTAVAVAVVGLLYLGVVATSLLVLGPAGATARRRWPTCSASASAGRSSP